MEKIDPINIPNVNFSIEVDHKEIAEDYKKQRLERGFDDTETWNLDMTISAFIVPRLKRFKEVNDGCPPELTEEQWDEAIDKMIKFFEFNTDDSNFLENNPYQEGFDLFHKYFFYLWW